MSLFNILGIYLLKENQIVEHYQLLCKLLGL